MDRRQLLTTVAGIGATSLAGCTGMLTGEEAASGEPIPEDEFDFQVNSPEQVFMMGLAAQDGYEGEFEDWSGHDTVSIELAAAESDDPPVDPPAIVVDAGTTVTFEWVDDAAEYRLVIYEAGAEEPTEAMGNDGIEADAGFTYDYTFSTAGLNRVASVGPGDDASIAVYVDD